MAIFQDAASVAHWPTISIDDFLDAMRRAHGGEIPLNPERGVSTRIRTPYCVPSLLPSRSVSLIES